MADGSPEVQEVHSTVEGTVDSSEEMDKDLWGYLPEQVLDSDGELSRMTRAVEILLRGIGEDIHREGLVKTPLRVTSAFRGALAGYQLSARDIVGSALFAEAGLSGKTGCGGGSGGIVVVSNIASFALCEDCLLPFRLRCHVAYIPCGERVVGLSKFPRVVEAFAKRLQNPQKFADEVVEALDDSILPIGVGIIVESCHLKNPGFSPDGADEKTRSGLGWTSTLVRAGKGQFEILSGHLWDEFLTILQLEGVDIRKSRFTSGKRRFCSFAVHNLEQVFPSGENFDPIVEEPCCKADDSLNVVRPTASAAIPASAAALANGVESLLRAVGVTSIVADDLRCPAARFVQWLTVATQGDTASVTIPNSPDRGSGNTFTRGNIQNSSHGKEGLSNGGTQGNANVPAAPYSNGNGHSSCNQNTRHMDGTIGGVEHISHEVSSNGSCSPHDTIHGFMDQGKCLLKIPSPMDIWPTGEPALCLELEIPFSTLCEHHLLPFFGFLHVGYIGVRGGRPQHISKSLLAQIVSMYSRRLQAQERLTRQIAEAVVSLPGSEGGAMVVAHASHMCMMSRGVVKLGCTTATMATTGQFSTEQTVRADFLRRIPRKGQAERFTMDY